MLTLFEGRALYLLLVRVGLQCCCNSLNLIREMDFGPQLCSALKEGDRLASNTDYGALHTCAYYHQLTLVYHLSSCQSSFEI